MVGRLVQQQQVRLLQKEHAEAGASALSPAQGGDGQRKVTLAEAEAGQGGLHPPGVGGTAGLGELLLQLGIGGVGALGAGRARLKLRLQFAQALLHRHQTRHSVCHRREQRLAGEVHILRQVADVRSRQQEIAPVSGASTPAIRRSSVVLPQPLRPTRATFSPGPTMNDTDCSTCCSP